MTASLRRNRRTTGVATSTGAVNGRPMKATGWRDLNHEVSAERREELKREAVAELDRMGFAAHHLTISGPLTG